MFNILSAFKPSNEKEASYAKEVFGELDDRQDLLVQLAAKNNIPDYKLKFKIIEIVMKRYYKEKKKKELLDFLYNPDIPSEEKLKKFGIKSSANVVKWYTVFPLMIILSVTGFVLVFKYTTFVSAVIILTGVYFLMILFWSQYISAIENLYAFFLRRK